MYADVENEVWKRDTNMYVLGCYIFLDRINNQENKNTFYKRRTRYYGHSYPSPQI